MAWEKKVIWSEGMMLQPHHFQQQSRFHESQLRYSSSLCRPHFWGISSIEIDKSHLNTERASDFNISQSSIGPLKYRFLLYSDTSSIISGNRETLLNIPLGLTSISNAAMDFVDGKYQITLENIIISSNDNTDVSTVASNSSDIVISSENLFDPVVDPNQSVSLKENPILNTIF